MKEMLYTCPKIEVYMMTRSEIRWYSTCKYVIVVCTVRVYSETESNLLFLPLK